MSLWGMFSGSDARRWAQNARDDNNAQLGAGYGAMKDAYGQGYGEARGQMQPYADAGRRGMTTYENMLGNNGAAAQQGAQATYQQHNPYLQAEQGRMQQSLDRRAAATGQFNSGLNALGKARAVDESGFRNYTDYMNRQQGLGQMGLGASSALGGYAMQNANNLAGAEQWYRGRQMQTNTNYWNSQNQAQQGAFNNVLGAVGTAMDLGKMFMGVPKMPGGSGGNNYAAGGSNQLQNSGGYNNGWGYFGGGR